MVHIKFTARPTKTVISSGVDSMASDEALEASVQHRDASTEQQREALMEQQKVTSTEATSSRGAESDFESQYGDSRDSETASNNSGHLKVPAAAALPRITYNFGPSGIIKACVGSMENDTRYFPKGYGRAPDTESVPKPRVNEVVVFEDLFTSRIRMPPHLVLVDIMHKF
jgi:hypothetical protein